MPNKRRGFTLIELLIVVAIIAILAAIAVPNFLEAQVRSKVSRVKTDLRALDVALTAYHVDNGDYPPWLVRLTLVGLSLPTLPPYNPTSWRLHRLTTPVAYITSTPNDPFCLFGEYAFSVAVGGVQIPRWDTYNYGNYIAGVSDDSWLMAHWWMLQSLGPDRLNTMGGYLPSGSGYEALVSSAKQFPNFVYDPTNGTVSWGDILRAGPRNHQSKHPYYPVEQLH